MRSPSFRDQGPTKLFIDLQNVPDDGQVLDRVVPRDRVRLDDDAFSFGSDLRLSGRLLPTSEPAERSFRLEGQLQGVLRVVCVRCLTQYDVELNEKLDLLYLPQSENVALPTDSGADSEDGRALVADELAVAYYREDQIDLGQMIFEQTMLSLPMKPLCRPECAGLCPSCGVNRNEASCDCNRDESDPRWDGLKALLGS